MKTLLIVIAMTLIVATPLLAARSSTVSKRPRAAPASSASKPAAPKAAAKDVVGHVEKTDAEWKRILSASQYSVLRHAGTEIAYTGATWDNHAPGQYRCAGCGLLLFDSSTKFDSGTGWPSFWAPVAPTHVKIMHDSTLGLVRDEVVCARCGGHLGHVFDDGPAPTHERYCMNSAALTFEPAKK